MGTGTEPAREVGDLDPVLVDLVEPVPGVLGVALLLVSLWRWSRINRCGGLVDGIDGFRGSTEGSAFSFGPGFDDQPLAPPTYTSGFKKNPHFQKFC